MAVRRRLQRQRRLHNYSMFQGAERFNPRKPQTEKRCSSPIGFIQNPLCSLWVYCWTSWCMEVYASNPLTPLHQVLVALRCCFLCVFFWCFCNGFFCLKLVDTWFASNSSAGRAVRHVTDLLCTKTRHFISLSKGDTLASIKSTFHKIASKVPKRTTFLYHAMHGLYQTVVLRELIKAYSITIYNKLLMNKQSHRII